MQEAFVDPGFNKYTQGPGKDLDEELQPGGIALLKKKESNLNCRIALKKVPKTLTRNGLMNLCKRFGNVIDIHVPRDWPEPNPFIYVEYGSVSEADRAVREIPEIPIFGIKAKFATRKEREDGNETQLAEAVRDLEIGNSSIQEEYVPVDVAPKSQHILSKPVKPILPVRKPFVSAEQYEDSELKDVDPSREFQLERNSWRHQYQPDQELVNNYKKMAQQSDGKYDEKSRVYVARGMQNQRKSLMIRKCVFCESPADKNCEICYAPYCSVDCQRNDWYQHQGLCKPVPKLVSSKLDETTYQAHVKGAETKPVILDKFNPSIVSAETTDSTILDKSESNEMEQESPSQRNDKIVRNKISGITQNQPKKKKFQVPSIDFPKMGSRVVITAAADVNIIFIRPVDKENAEMYLKLQNMVQEYAKFADVMPRRPEPGDIVLAPFNSEYCRVMVMHVSEDKAMVSYIDYGNNGQVAISDIKRLDFKLRGMKRHVFKVALQDVQVKCENVDVIAYLNQLLEQETELMVSNCYQQTPHGGYTVELLEIQRNVNVNRHLNELGEIKEPGREDEKIMFGVSFQNFPSFFYLKNFRKFSFL